ncbi:serine/threonine-protein kinase PBS1 [Coffea arabica]|uniref:Serine/threonine-protein kinase PBS1 n=1 Tax=Coffea arabica TaxID=13443 RepID=A0A6P6UND3_COFAR|nr:probable serine/threonine-protein kinase PBL12 [Coffea arabica]
MSSTSSTWTMESIKDHPLMPARVVVAYDATKDRTEIEFSHTIRSIRSRGDILHGGDTLMFLGVLSKVPHPMGYQMQARPESFLGITHVRLVEEEVSNKVDFCVRLLQKSAEEYDSEGVDIEVKITAGTPTRKVVLQEVITSNATWVILDRHLRRDLRFYLKQIPCKVAIIEDNLSMVVVRPSTISDTDKVEPNLFISLAKNVPLLAAPNEENNEQFIMSCKSHSASMGSLENSDRIKSNLLPALKYNPQDHNISSHHELGPNSEDKSGRHAKGGSKPPISPQVIEKLRRKPSGQRSNDTPVLCIGCGMKTKPDIKDSMKFSFSEIQLATDDFSKDNLLGEGGYGHVYKGRLKDGQFIAAKLRKEASTQGFAEFLSEIYVLSFARHKNIVMLLGYCCKENLNILVYEYICNKSLEWHLFDNEGDVLEWHRRHSIAMGTAKGLHFLHEECRGSPIVHCDMRPSNILLTHDFVPMLGDFGLAKRRTDEGNMHKRILGTLGYLAPEYAENGIVSVKTDVYSFGIILIQLMSGRKVVDSNRLDQQHSLRQWAIPLIQRLALHELVDPRIQDFYDTYELYLMVRAAYLCVQTNPEMRPTMGEVLRLLEGESDHLNQLADQFVAHFSK